MHATPAHPAQRFHRPWRACSAPALARSRIIAVQCCREERHQPSAWQRAAAAAAGAALSLQACLGPCLPAEAQQPAAPPEVRSGPAASLGQPGCLAACSWLAQRRAHSGMLHMPVFSLVCRGHPPPASPSCSWHSGFHRCHLTSRLSRRSRCPSARRAARTACDWRLLRSLCGCCCPRCSGAHSSTPQAGSLLGRFARCNLGLLPCPRVDSHARSAPGGSRSRRTPHPTAPPIPSFPQELQLPNGLRLFLMEDHEVPAIRGTLLMLGGQRASPPDKARRRRPPGLGVGMGLQLCTASCQLGGMGPSSQLPHANASPSTAFALRGVHCAHTPPGRLHCGAGGASHH